MTGVLIIWLALYGLAWAWSYLDQEQAPSPAATRRKQARDLFNETYAAEWQRLNDERMKRRA